MASWTLLLRFRLPKGSLCFDSLFLDRRPRSVPPPFVGVLLSVVPRLSGDGVVLDSLAVALCVTVDL